MRERLKQWSAVAVLVLVAGGSLAACSDDGDQKSEGVGESAGTNLTEANFFEEVTDAQTKARTSHVKLAVKVAGQTISADGDLEVGTTPADTAMAMTMDTGQTGAGSLEMRLVDQVFYLNFGPMTENKFAEIDLTDTSNPLGKQYAEIIGSLDPAQQFKELEGAITSFDEKGEPKELDGVEAQPYVIGIDTSKIPAADEAGASLPKTIKYTMYVGPDNLPRRLITQLPDAGDTGTGGSTMTIDYTKWGEKVAIAKPKPAEITDKDLFSDLGGTTPSPS